VNSLFKALSLSLISRNTRSVNGQLRPNPDFP
jgi:hypothetical protein